ncbi:MAG: NAD-glutamate dehydrogenase [Propionicimonas sp.]
MFQQRYREQLPPEEVAGLDAGELERRIAAHLEFGRWRAPGQHLLRVITPRLDTDGWDVRGATVIQLVTDDRPFLVESLAMELARRGWSLQRLFHPQLVVQRDASGELVDSGGTEVAESWVAMEAASPLGVGAAEVSDGLLAGLSAALDDVTVAVADWQPMLAAARAAIDAIEEMPQPPAAVGVLPAVELLRWLADDHFVFLGYREYRIDGQVFTAAPGTGLGILRGDDDPDTFHAVPTGEPEVLVVTKDPRRSRVHRNIYLDYIGVRIHDAAGRPVAERRFLGLFAASAYAESVHRIPVLATKAREIAARIGYDPSSYSGHAVRQAIESCPRDELFQAEVESLVPMVTTLARVRGRRVVKAFVRHDRYGRFVTAQVYLPRDRYNTAVRERISQILLTELGGESLEYHLLVSQGQLTRLYFVIRLPATAGDLPVPDADQLTALIEAATRTWEDGFYEAAAGLPSEQRGVEFSEAYEEAVTPQTAVADLAIANQLRDDHDLRFALRPSPDAGCDVRLVVFSLRPLELAQVLPHLSMLGVAVTDERPFEWQLRGRRVLLYDFGLRLPGDAPAVEDWDVVSRARFVAAFEASWRGRLEARLFNRLVLTAGLTWQQVNWLRGISRYLQQAAVGFSQQYIAAAMHANPGLAAALVRVFQVKFDPALFGDAEARAEALRAAEADLESRIDQVASLDHDRILRMFAAVIRAMVRTNAFAGDPRLRADLSRQVTGTDDAPLALAYKLLPRELALLPQPRPAYEVFVYSPRVQGVHLRFGKVARGGLRWSDRKEDFRTEVLGLVKAQTVKNTVIVPVGAKGGFVPQRLPDPATDRAGWLAEGQACYRIFIDALLSVTDNSRGGVVEPPPGVVRYDGDDPYLVVAADKGTASFSDIANEISVARGFWLGDAFASGGSSGYDHKGMGITARGAWESVKHHFHELGLDPQTTDFTAVGIGDMSGDVFGNGMLASRHIRLVAAFDHRHIFLDPDPAAAVSFVERKRLFELPRSSWADYDPQLISVGGGVYSRTAKRIAITAPVRQALGLPDSITRLSPPELIRAILQAPVDLLYNGGIGTYVKGSGEPNAAVGDKANDAIRVNGSQVRARCAIEGGNLGWTQPGRIEYAIGGGRVNTDFIDNSAGVDTSDHEVNLKVLLAAALADGKLRIEERDPLLASMTDEVAQLVLRHNVDQNLALSNSESRTRVLAGQHEDWMRVLTEAGFLDRGLEYLPDSAAMAERIAAGRGLTRPELAVLLAYTKIALKEWVLAGDLPDDPYLADRLTSYFPQPVRERFAGQIPAHPLARQIITTVAVNRFVNSQGITAYHRLSTETGAQVADVIRAQLAARAIYNVGLSEVQLGRMNDLDAELVTELRMELRRMVERATRWLLHNRRSPLDVRAAIGEFTEPVAQIRAGLRERVTPRQSRVVEQWYRSWLERGASEPLAASMATAAHAHYALGIAATARRLSADPKLASEVFFTLGERLGLDRLVEQIDVLPRQVRWDAMARAALRDELLEAQDDLTAAVLAGSPADVDAAGLVDAWLKDNPAVQGRTATLREVCEGEPDLARMSVGLGVVRSLLA